MKYKIRVIVVLQSGNVIFQDFITPSQHVALVQFGAGLHDELEIDPVFDVTTIELGREDWTAEEEQELTETYISDMLSQLTDAQ
jgi:hypothetical protein